MSSSQYGSLLPVVLTLTNTTLLDGYWKRQDPCVSQNICSGHLYFLSVPTKSVLTMFDRAVLRIKKELEVAPAGKVRSSQPPLAVTNRISSYGF
jgi:hypothetical protein